jgi:segregation and condensation protein B
VAYKQPCTKSAVDEIRGVESGHLMRGLLDRGMIAFGGKSELPGRPMMYETTRRFLEIFGLRNIKELPTLNEIDQLIPEGIGEEQVEKPKLSDLTGELSQTFTGTYSEGEEDLIDISKELSTIETTSAFFEDEKRRQREKRDLERAQDIRERLTIGEAVEEKDKRWLAKYEAQIAAANAPVAEAVVAGEAVVPGAEEVVAGAEETVVLTETPVVEATEEATNEPHEPESSPTL